LPAWAHYYARPVAQQAYFVDLRELFLLMWVLAFYLFIWGFLDDLASMSRANAIGPVAMMAVLLAGAACQLRRQPCAIWVPLFWFRIATSVYFGLGQIAPYLANDTTRLFIRSLYWFGEDEAFKVGLINILSVLTVLGTAAVVERQGALRRYRTGPSTTSPSSQTYFFALFFLILGGIARYLIVLPGTLGFADFPPGIVQPFAKSYAVGLFLLTLLALRGNWGAAVTVAVLAPVDIVVGFLTFAKTEVLFTLLFVFLAVLHHRLTVWRILVGALVIVCVYSQLDPYIHYGRDEIMRSHKDAGVPLERRLEIISQFNGHLNEGATVAERQSALSRFSYINAATMVIQYHDYGNVGTSLQNALVVLIPRLIWPSKPEITGVGKELYLQATSQVGSSISPGLFAEAYWNFGWMGIPMLMIPLGAILCVFSHYSFNVMQREAWIHLPAVLLGVLAGVRVDGWYVADIIGGCSTAMVIALVVTFIERLSGGRAVDVRQS